MNWTEKMKKGKMIMKKTISLILAATLLLTALTACGSKAPAEPAETTLYGAVAKENAPTDALGTVVYLGYYESADAMRAELPEALSDLPIAEMGGSEAYAIIPRFEGESVTLYAVEMDENANAVKSEAGTQYDSAVLVLCNESDIMSNVAVQLAQGEDRVSFSPYVSLKDGSIVTDVRVPIGTIE